VIAVSNGSYPKIFDRPKPARLRNAIAQFDKGEITRDELSRIEDEVTVEVIEEQIRAGIEMVTDGMIRWEDSLTYFARKLRGVTLDGLIRYLDTNTYFRQPVVDDRVEWDEPVLVRDYRFAAAKSGVPVKIVLPGPYTLARLTHAPGGNKRRLVLDYAAALHDEAMALSGAGAPLIQFDEPLILRQKEDWGLFAEAIGAVVNGVRTKTAVTTYFGTIDHVYPKILDLPVNVLGLDFVTTTARPNMLALRGEPFTKELAAGVLDARNTRLEPVDQVVTLLQEICEVVPPEKLYVCPNTGLEYLPRDTAFLKLARTAEVAARAREVLV
jgi:5-methyltetrahydropteroyltriglutamate--homocysteine methyltransferase